jgi:hypothetical protein
MPIISGYRGPIQRSPPIILPRCRPLIIAVITIVVLGLISQSSNISAQSTASLLATIPQAFVSTGSVAAAAMDPGIYPIFDCAKLLEELGTNPAMRELDPNMGKIYARHVIENPSFYVALHNKTFDSTRWAVMQYGYYYERLLTDAFQEVLREFPPGSRVLDVGGEYFFRAVRVLMLLSF